MYLCHNKNDQYTNTPVIQNQEMITMDKKERIHDP